MSIDTKMTGDASQAATCPVDANSVSPAIGGSRFWVLNLFWLPHALFALYLIAAYTVDLPNIDQWQFELPFLKKVAEGQATLGDLIALQLEHRLASNRIAGYLVAKLFGWDQKVECGVVLLLGCAIAFCICVLSCRRRGQRMISRALQMSLMAALLFGMPQYASWNNCAAIVWFSVECYLLVGLVIAGTQASFVVRLTSCLLLAVISTFSSSTGMLTWILFVPALLAPLPLADLKRQWKMIGIWGVAACLSIGGYFVGFHRPEGSASMLGILLDPTLFLKFFFANVGSSFGGGMGIDAATQGAIAGVVIVALFGAAACYIFAHRKDRELVRCSVSWLMLGAYGLITGAAITLGRARDGLMEALASRFVNTHVLTVIALIFLLPFVLGHISSARKARRESGLQDPEIRGKRFRLPEISNPFAAGLMASMTTAILILHICYSVSVFDIYPYYKRRFLNAKAAVLFLRFFAEEQMLKVALNQTSAALIPGVEFLNSQGYLRPKLMRSAKVKDLTGSSDQGLGWTGQYGSLEQASQPAPGATSLSGWAVFPLRNQPADAVLLSWETGSEDATIFAVAQGGPLRPDLATRFGNSSYRWAGWVAAFENRLLPKGKLTIRAWAFDMESAKVFELTGVLSVENP